MSSRSARRWAALLVLPVGVSALTALAVAAPARAGSAAAPTAASAAVAPVAWHGCADPGPGLQCATVRVPLDYDRPTGATIALALVRHPATAPAARWLGSLFIDPGGPGGSGTDFVRQAADILDVALKGRYDLIGLDPRGIALSTPLVCLNSTAQLDRLVAPWPFPVTAFEQSAQRGYDARLAAACAQRGGAIIDHMSTADVARDLDRLRAAVGDPTLNYLGYSYGTQIGTVYANLFPERVGRVVLDGVLDPIAWTTGTLATAAQPFSTRLHSDKGAQVTLEQFFVGCDRAVRDSDASTVCEFGPPARSRFAALAARLRAHPLTLSSGRTLTYADLVATTLAALYSAQSWPFLSEFLASAESGTPAEVAAARAALARSLGVTDPALGAVPQTVEALGGVACSDGDNPSSYGAWPREAARADAESGYFGALWTWVSSPCQAWPGQAADRYLGPWTARTANPVLVVGNRYDPATRYQGAVTVSRLLPNSRLLTYEGWGHTAYLGAGSSCTDAAVSGYLLTGALPAVGTRCPVEFDPFRSGPPAARAGQAAALRAVTVPRDLPAAVRRALAG
jgi:pimeloyl-ACP methyl ester carboxylesterase